MEMNWHGSGSVKREKGCSGSGERKKGCSRYSTRKENRNCYSYGSVSGDTTITTSCSIGAAFSTQSTGGVYDIYDRNSDPHGPRQDLLHYAQLAIASYNKTIKTKSQCYTVVDIVRSEKYIVAGSLLFIDFIAKQDGADAITFRAQLWLKIGGLIEVTSTGPITAEQAASKYVRDCSMWPDPRERDRAMEMNWHGSGSGSGSVKREKGCKENLNCYSYGPGGVYDIYDRNSDPHGPRQDLLHYAQLAIASYNKTQTQCYTVVDIVRSEKYIVAGSLLFLDFIAKQDGADAITFRAQLWLKIGGCIEVTSTGPITAEQAASKYVRDCSMWP